MLTPGRFAIRQLGGGLVAAAVIWGVLWVVDGYFANLLGLAWLGLLAWLVVSVAVVGPTAVRVLIARRRAGVTAADETAWASRRRAGRGAAMQVVVSAAGLWFLFTVVAQNLDTGLPGEHGVTVTLAADTRGRVAVDLRDPDARDCADPTRLILRYVADSPPRIDRNGRTIKPISTGTTEEGLNRATYLVPMTWERTNNSCYYELPAMRQLDGSTKVFFYVYGIASPADSVPPPDGAAGGYWQWTCRAVPDGGKCRIIAVVDADPSDRSIGFLLFLGGTILTLTVAGLWTGGRRVIVGWYEDGRGIVRAFRASGASPSPDAAPIEVAPSSRQPGLSRAAGVATLSAALSYVLWRSLRRRRF